MTPVQLQSIGASKKNGTKGFSQIELAIWFWFLE